VAAVEGGVFIPIVDVNRNGVLMVTPLRFVVGKTAQAVVDAGRGPNVITGGVVVVTVDSSTVGESPVFVLAYDTTAGRVGFVPITTDVPVPVSGSTVIVPGVFADAEFVWHGDVHAGLAEILNVPLCGAQAYAILVPSVATAANVEHVINGAARAALPTKNTRGVPGTKVPTAAENVASLPTPTEIAETDIAVPPIPKT